MKDTVKKNKLWFICLLLAVVFVIYTILVKVVDVRPIGPGGSNVGFGALNEWFINLTGVHLNLYKFTDYTSIIISVLIGATFLIVGIVEWVKRKKITKVDSNILALGIFYIMDLVVFLLFQFVKINYRPVLIDGKLEASYPSSTTLLAITLLVTCIDQINIYIKNNKVLNITLISVCVLLTAFFVIGRAVCGVHWLSDIIGGVICAAVLISFYMATKGTITKLVNKEDK